jgi:hypothetical protein
MKTNILVSRLRASMTKGSRRPHTRLILAAAVSLAAALALSACTTVATTTQPSLVRVIDASYIAPAVNVTVEGQLLASNIGQGTITPYGTLTPNIAAPINVSAVTGNTVLVSTTGTLLAGHQHSVFLTDNGAAPNGYTVTILEDQQQQAAEGHSAFRFLNQAPKTGAVDIYMMPAGATFANTVPLVTNLPVGATAGYISFISQTVTMVVTPTGLTTPFYAFSPMTLTGGEVRTVLIMDTQLTSNPAVEVFTAIDAGPSN